MFVLLMVTAFSAFLENAGCIADEGMYPLSELDQVDLRKHGLEMKPEEIFNPGQTSLIDGICRVNGCTGSFVSPDGLIFTNHHCAYRAIQTASSAGNDYLKNGFQAKTRGDEIEAKGYTVRITQSYKDVSPRVLDAVKSGMTFEERSKAIEKRRKEIEKKAEEDNPGLRAEVAEMFIGKTYVLFLYTYIKDVRLVFAPPASVGNFGGEVDNWEWPRHTGDFAFMRAYVAPDGSSAEYSPKNVPYKAKRHIQVAPQGVDEGDYVMLLGYPGRTARHKSASFLQYERDVRLPSVIRSYQEQIRIMEAAGEKDRAIALKHSSRIKGLANVEKRSRGQLKGLQRAGLVKKRADAESRLQSYIDSDDSRKQKFGKILTEINKVYGEMTEAADHELSFQQMRSGSRMLYIASTICEASVERQKDDLEREAPYMDRNWQLTLRRLRLAHKDLHVPTDIQMTKSLMKTWDAAQHRTRKDNANSNQSFRPSDQIVDRLYFNSRLHHEEFFEQLLAMAPEELNKSQDSFVMLAKTLNIVNEQYKKTRKDREGRLNQLYGDLIEIKKEFLKTRFVPDANGTLRLTFGHVKSYSPEDAVIKTPITTLQGVIDKTTGVEPFITPQKILDMHAKRDFGPFKHPRLNDVPTAILYDTDTTGGNSGSPILNSKGQLVGVNFDRAFEATINDFAWNESYSRSIGVDIRYALWITGKVFEADHLLKEMGVNSKSR